MKKQLLFLALIFSVSLQALHLKVHNSSNKQIEVKANFAGPGICGSKNFRVDSHKTEKRGVGGCCLKNIKIRSVEGDNSKWYHGTPRKSGFIGSCFSNKFIAIGNPDGSITVEQ